MVGADNAAPVPLIAVLAFETPGRLEWAREQGATSYLLKPIGSNGAFNAQVVAVRLFAERRDMRTTLADLSDRVRARPIVVRAAIAVMEGLGVSDERALTLLRQKAMRERMIIQTRSLWPMSRCGLVTSGRMRVGRT